MLFALAGMAGYKVAPIWAGQHAINTFLKQNGVPPGKIPAGCRRELAKDALSAATLLTIGKTTAARVAQYTDCLEVRAIQVVALFTMPDRASPFLKAAWKTRIILEAHGLNPPP